VKRIFLKKQTEEEKEKMPPDKGSFPDFMKKEIFTQAGLLQNVILKFIKADKINFDFLKIHFDRIKRIYIASNSAFFGCAVAAGYNFEVLTDVVCVPILLSEFNCANPILDKNTLVIITAENAEERDVCLAQKRCSSSGARALLILDYAHSGGKSNSIISLDYESCALFPTANYTAKYLVLCLIALYFGEKNKVITELYVNIATKMLLSLCSKVKGVNEADYFVNSLVNQLDGRDIILTGRNVDYSTALYGETALNALCKIKARAVPCAELKFFKSEDFAVIAFVSNRELMELTLEDIKPYKDNAVIIAPGALSQSMGEYNTLITYHDSIPLFNPVISAAVLQLFFYNAAKNKNLPTDKI